MTKWIQLSLLVLGLFVAGAALLVVSVDRYRSLPQNVYVAPLGQEIQYDDFAFAVAGSRVVTEFAGGPTAVRPAGRFVVVRMRVANHAQRVDFRFRPSKIRLVADDGSEFTLSAAGQSALRETEPDGCAAELPAGTTCTTELVFDVPPHVDRLQAKVGTNLRFLDMLDRVVYGKRLLDLN